MEELFQPSSHTGEVAQAMLGTLLRLVNPEIQVL